MTRSMALWIQVALWVQVIHRRVAIASASAAVVVVVEKQWRP